MSAPIQVRREDEQVVLDLRNESGDSIVAVRLSPEMAVRVASALIGAAR